MTDNLIIKMRMLIILSCLCVICDSVPINGVSPPTNVTEPPDLATSTGLTPTTTPNLARHKLLRIKAKPKQEYLQANGTLMISGDSTMRVFDYHEIIHPKFDPSSFLTQAAKGSTQKIEVPLSYGQHYFIFLPPALIKEYQQLKSRSQRRRFKRHHPSILQSVLGELQDYALVPIQSSSGQIRYVLLKSPKFVISGVGPNGKPITASIPVTQQPNNPLSLVQPHTKSASQSNQAHHTQDTPTIPAPAPIADKKVLPQIMDMLSPMKIGPATQKPPPNPKPWTPPTSARTPPTRARTQRLTRNNRPFSTSMAKKAILGDRPAPKRSNSIKRINKPRPISRNFIDNIGSRGPSRNERPGPTRFERIERPVPAAGPIDAFFNENVVTQPPVQHMSHVHSHSRGHIQSQTVHMGPNSQPRVDTSSQNIQTSGQATAITSSSGSKSTITSGSGASNVDAVHADISNVNSALNSVGGASVTGGNDTHIVHHTEVVETVIETKNQAAAVAQTDTAAVATQNTSVSSQGGNSGSVASHTSASSAASASTAVASKQEQVVSTKKTTKTTAIKKGTDANGQPAAVHEITEVVEHTSAAKTGAATATKTDAAAATSSGAAVVGTNGGAPGSAATVDSASASAAASSSASVTSNNATTTSVKTTIKKTTVTKMVGNGTVDTAAKSKIAAPAIDTVKSLVSDTKGTATSLVSEASASKQKDTYAVSTGDGGASLSAEALAVKALDLHIPPLKKQKNKKRAKTAILSENNDRQSVGVKAALIATPKPKIAAKIADITPAPYQTTTVPTTPEPPEEMTTTEMIPTTTEEMEMEEYPIATSTPTMDFFTAPTTMLTYVAGWAGPTTPSGLGPMDRINTTDVPEEIEARPDKTPAEMRRELAKLNPNLSKQQARRRPGAQRNSRQRSAPPKGVVNSKRGRRKRPNLQARVARRNKARGARTRASNSRNNPRRRNQDRGSGGRSKAAGTRPRTADPVARWLWNNLENGEMFENMPFWMLLK